MAGSCKHRFVLREVRSRGVLLLGLPWYKRTVMEPDDFVTYVTMYVCRKCGEPGYPVRDTASVKVSQ